MCLQSSLHIFFLNTLTWYFITCQLKSLELGPNICANFRNIQLNMALASSDILSVQFRYSVESKSLQAPGPQQSGLPYPSLTPRACSNSCPLSWWCHSTISSSVVPFACLQSFPSSGSFPVSHFFASGGQIIGVSALASVLPMNIQDCFL